MTTARQLRSTALGLLEVEEETSDGGTTFRVRGRPLARLADGVVRLPLPVEAVDRVLAEHPEAQRDEHAGRTVGVRVPLGALNGQQLNHWVREAWKHRAPRRLVARAEEAEAAEPGFGGLPASIGRPATRALVEAGVRSLDDVAALDAAALDALHGVGPTAVRRVRAALAERDGDG